MSQKTEILVLMMMAKANIAKAAIGGKMAKMAKAKLAKAKKANIAKAASEGQMAKMAKAKVAKAKKANIAKANDATAQAKAAVNAKFLGKPVKTELPDFGPMLRGIIN